MKVKLIYSTLLAAIVFSTSIQAQDGPNVVRSRLCNVNTGYSMSEVVEFARNIDWQEEYAPSAMFFREARAVPGDFQRDWDFVWSSFYQDWDDQYQTISAQNSRPGGRTPLSHDADDVAASSASPDNAITKTRNTYYLSLIHI